MINNRLIALFILAALMTQSCTSENKTEASADSATADHVVTDSATKSDTTTMAANSKATENGAEGAMFLEQAAIGGIVEVEMGKIGQQKAEKKDIKEFAAMIEKDHTDANAELKALAQRKGMKLPTALPKMKEEHITNLKTMTGKNFDSYYTNMMVEEHITDIALFEGASKSPDTSISNFAAKTLPVLQKHYKKARELSAQFDQNKQ